MDDLGVPLFLGKKHILFCRWWFQIFLGIFTPNHWGNDPIWRAYFSDALKPPTTVDGWNPANQLRLLVYPIIYDGFYTSQVVVWNFLHQQYETAFCRHLIPDISCREVWVWVCVRQVFHFHDDLSLDSGFVGGIRSLVSGFVEEAFPKLSLRFF